MEATTAPSQAAAAKCAPTAAIASAMEITAATFEEAAATSAPTEAIAGTETRQAPTLSEAAMEVTAATSQKAATTSAPAKATAREDDRDIIQCTRVPRKRRAPPAADEDTLALRKRRHAPSGPDATAPYHSYGVDSGAILEKRADLHGRESTSIPFFTSRCAGVQDVPRRPSRIGSGRARDDVPQESINPARLSRRHEWRTTALGDPSFHELVINGRGGEKSDTETIKGYWKKD
ncbi:hypothetical protein BWQ96_08697 [Gracilariopsis chorda]|uniref:Uncharacterized protein n=1 Tax=Gracilariopsis chorda TaxID=448386 RepID=A0A2V3IHT0_9FLOR|nr:hypothetical protein BWQ96_08697 [Gracilariopsis chorda]|eukprot:PXF41583.1 hypothetical protein BWQ96_08697 [Gracilariopsis chorda]